MSTLHLLDKPEKINLCIATCEQDDMVILIGSAVLIPFDTNMNNINHRFLSVDVAARGLMTNIDDSFVVTPDQVADLCVTFARQVSW